MGMYKSQKFVPEEVENIASVGDEIRSHFEAQGYDVVVEPTVTGGLDISLTKGGMFKSLVGLKTALKMSIEPFRNGTQINAGIGIFGMQVVPTAVALLVFSPVFFTQAWGLVQQTKLDDEAINVAESAIYRQKLHRGARVASEHSATYCVLCGSRLSPRSKFCSECGTAASSPSSHASTEPV